MNCQSALPPQALRACARHGVVPTRHFLAVDISQQKLSLFRCARKIKTFRCSTSRFGIGEIVNSQKTPRGLHRIAKKIGGGWPVGATFSSRQVTGFTWQGKPDARITTRILWLDGLEPGFNRGGNVDSFARYIYIHGTGDETTIGRPDSCGCVQLAAVDLIPLYDLVSEGALVWLS
jgi:hypothetical protein